MCICCWCIWVVAMPVGWAGSCRMGKNTLTAKDAQAAADKLWGSDLPWALPTERDAAEKVIKRHVAELFFEQQPVITEPVRLQAAAAHLNMVLGDDWEETAGFNLSEALQQDECFAVSHTSAGAAHPKATIRLRGLVLMKVLGTGMSKTQARKAAAAAAAGAAVADAAATAGATAAEAKVLAAAAAARIAAGPGRKLSAVASLLMGPRSLQAAGVLPPPPWANIALPGGSPAPAPVKGRKNQAPSNDVIAHHIQAAAAAGAGTAGRARAGAQQLLAVAAETLNGQPPPLLAMQQQQQQQWCPGPEAAAGAVVVAQELGAGSVPAPGPALVPPQVLYSYSGVTPLPWMAYLQQVNPGSCQSAPVIVVDLEQVQLQQYMPEGLQQMLRHLGGCSILGLGATLVAPEGAAGRSKPVQQAAASSSSGQAGAAAAKRRHQQQGEPAREENHGPPAHKKARVEIAAVATPAAAAAAAAAAAGQAGAGRVDGNAGSTSGLVGMLQVFAPAVALPAGYGYPATIYVLPLPAAGPVAGAVMGELQPLLSNPQVVKVMHTPASVAAALQQQFGIQLQGVLDTRLLLRATGPSAVEAAAAVLGPTQDTPALRAAMLPAAASPATMGVLDMYQVLGYHAAEGTAAGTGAAVVADTELLQRPLSPQLLVDAAEEVRYLLPAANRLLHQLPASLVDVWHV